MPSKHDSDSSSTDAPHGPLPVVEDCWMVGRRNPEATLRCNTYIRTFRQFGGHRNVCIDPGSRFDFEQVKGNVERLLGEMRELPVGCDLLASEGDRENLETFRVVLQRLVEYATEERGEMNVSGRINAQDPDDDLLTHFQLRERTVQLQRGGYAALAKTYSPLVEDESEDFIDGLRQTTLGECQKVALPVPPVISRFIDARATETLDEKAAEPDQ